MASPEMYAGGAGHAFLAAWYTTNDITQALAAFDAAEHRPPPPVRPGWYSDSTIGLIAECPTTFYYQRLHGGRGVERVYPEPEGDALIKRADALARVMASARDACRWLVESGNTGEDRFTTWGTEVYLETPEPFRFRMFLDHLVWDRQTETLGVRDHKFTWKNDARVGLRLLYSDQLLLYAATWNAHAPHWGLPLIDFVIPHVIIVSLKGAHAVMPADPKLITVRRQNAFWARMHRVQEMADAFATQTSERGPEWAARWMNPRACFTWSACPFAPVCHDEANPDTAPYIPSTRPQVGDAEED